jgi:hypothetical protein
MRGPCRFRKGEVVRAAKAAEAAGLLVERVEIDPATGKISVFVGKPAESTESQDLT